MLRTRLFTAAVLLPLAAGTMWLGGWAFLALVAALMTLGEMEFCQLARRCGYRPAVLIGIGLTWVLLVDAQFPAWGLTAPALAIVLLGSLAWQLRRHRGTAVADWALTLAGGLYLGVCGGCLLRLRNITPDGLWWSWTAIPAIVIADSSAFFAGRTWGRHKMAPELSPGKTWEGYSAGVVAGTLLTWLLATLWVRVADGPTSLSGLHGVILGLVITVVAPLGDLAISMIKRGAKVKDSGNSVPGHGGALDRVDSILWAAVIGYYYVAWFASGP